VASTYRSFKRSFIKEKSHVVDLDYHRGPGNTLAARLFRSEHKFKLPKNRQLDPCSDRHRGHTRHIEAPWHDLDPSHIQVWTSSFVADDSLGLPSREAICHPVFQPGGQDCCAFSGLIYLSWTCHDLPQVAETNTPRPMDVAGLDLL
jgi:hypothetical protein